MVILKNESVTYFNLFLNPFMNMLCPTAFLSNDFKVRPSSRPLRPHKYKWKTYCSSYWTITFWKEVWGSFHFDRIFVANLLLLTNNYFCCNYFSSWLPPQWFRLTLSPLNLLIYHRNNEMARMISSKFSISGSSSRRIMSRKTIIRFQA